MSSELKPIQAWSEASWARRREFAVWAMRPGDGSQNILLVIACRKARARLIGSNGVLD